MSCNMHMISSDMNSYEHVWLGHMIFVLANQYLVRICVLGYFKAMTHQRTQLLSWVWSGQVGACGIGLQFDSLLHFSLVPDCLVGSRPPYN